MLQDYVHYRPVLCTTIVHKGYLCLWEVGVTPDIFINREAGERIGSVRPSVRLSVNLSGFVRPTLCTTLWVQDYVLHHWPALCTTRLRCAPWCTRGTYVLWRSFVQTTWCTRRFCMLSAPTMMAHNTMLSVLLSACDKQRQVDSQQYCFITNSSARWVGRENNFCEKSFDTAPLRS